MYQITALTDKAKQKYKLIVGDNDICELYLYFLPRQNSWYFDWSYNDITSNGNKVVLSPNILRQFKTRIPFGLAFLSNDYIPPFKVDDFLSRVRLYTLDADEVQEIETEVFAKNAN